MRNRATAACAALVLAASLSPAAASDVNRISNGEFDEAAGVAEWSNLHTDYSDMLPDSTDSDLCPPSGSMYLSNTENTVPFATAQFRTCTRNVTPGEMLQISARFRFFEATAASRATLIVFFYESANCSGDSLAGQATQLIQAGEEVWQSVLESSIEAPANTASAELRIHLTKNSESDSIAEVLVDRVALAPDGLAFAEDHEIGDPCRWSAEQD